MLGLLILLSGSKYKTVNCRYKHRRNISKPCGFFRNGFYLYRQSSWRKGLFKADLHESNLWITFFFALEVFAISHYSTPKITQNRWEMYYKNKTWGLGRHSASILPPPPPPIPSLLALIGKKENLGTRLNPKWKLILDVVRQLLHFGIQQLNFSPKSWCNSLVPDKVVSVTERTFTWNLLFWTRSAKETSSHRCWNLYQSP